MILDGVLFHDGVKDRLFLIHPVVLIGGKDFVAEVAVT
jgi:hypothetical protein